MATGRAQRNTSAMPITAASSGTSSSTTSSSTPADSNPIRASLMLVQASASPADPSNGDVFGYINRSRRSILPTEAPIQPSRARRSKRTQLRTVFRSASGALHRVFRVGSKKTSRPLSTLIAPGIYAGLSRSGSRSSMRSRRSAVMGPVPGSRGSDMSSTVSSSGRVPSIFRTSPSGKRLTIHEYAGPGAKLSPVRKSVLFSHPAISALVSAPLTPLTPLPPSAGSAGIDSASLRLGTADSTAYTGQVDPVQMVRVSYNGVHIEGTAEQLRQLGAQLDGLPRAIAARTTPASPRPQASRNPPSLPYVPKAAPLSLDHETGLQTDADDKTRMQQHRLAALAALQSPAFAPIAAPAEKGSHPDSLLPGRLFTKRRLRKQTRHTIGGYVAYRPDPVAFSTNLSPPTQAGATTSPRRDSGASSTPSFAADNHLHSQLYTRVESGVWAPSPALPSTHERPRPATPAPQSHFSIGSSHYSPASPTASGAPVWPSAPVLLAPSSSASKAIKRKAVPAAVRNFSRPEGVDVNKALPAPPGPTDPRRFTNGVVPAQLAMNDNGFPILSYAGASKAATRKTRSGGRKPKSESVVAGKEVDTEKGRKAKKMADAIGRFLVCGY